MPYIKWLLVEKMKILLFNFPAIYGDFKALSGDQSYSLYNKLHYVLFDLLICVWETRNPPESFGKVSGCQRETTPIFTA